MPTVRSSPEANWAAPSDAATAVATKIPLRVCDITDPSPHGDRYSNVSHTRRVLGRADHITVSEKILNLIGTTFGAASHLGSRLFPPAPLTGDVGRGCGDAS